MALQGSGEIKMSQINVELGRASTATISLDAAENGTYVAINTSSASYPSSANPAAMSEWYGYDHSASTGSKEFTIYADQSYSSGDNEGACGINGADTMTLYYDIGGGSGSACPSTGVTVYEDSNGNTAFAGGNAWWRSFACGNAYYITDSGYIEGIASCEGR